MSNRSPKYNRKKAKEREAYSVRSLVTEITGMDQDSPGFEASLKEVQRITMTMRKITGGTDKNFKVASEFKDGTVYLTKAFLPGGEYRALYEKLRDDVSLTEKEQIQLTELFKKGTKKNRETPENTFLLEQAEAEEEFINIMDDILSILHDCIKLADSIENHATKVSLAKKLKEQLSQTVDSWKQDVSIARFEEIIMTRIIEIDLERGYSIDEIITEKKSELLNEVMKDSGLDTESLIREFVKEQERENP